MLEIILCDDDRFILAIEEEKIQKIIMKNQVAARIVCSSTDYKEVMQFLYNNPKEYLYFIDLDFGEGKMNGIDIARMIKKKEPRSKIVFVTNHHEMALKVLKSGVEPFGFIEKTTDIAGMNHSYKKYIQLALASECAQKETDGELLELIVSPDETIQVMKANILYVEAVKTMSHCIAYHTIDNSVITVRDTMEHALERLGPDFMKSHRSVIINKKYTVGFDDGMVKFSNGQKAACSFRMRNEVKGAIQGNAKFNH